MSNHTAEQPKSGADALREMQELKRELETIQADAITEDGEISPKELERTLRSAILRQQGTIPTNPEDMSAAERAAAVMDRAGRLQSLDFRTIQPETFEGIEALDIQKLTDSMLECFEQTAAAAIEVVNKIAESWESDQERLAKSLQQIADVLKQREDYKTALQPFLAAELEKVKTQHPELETVTAELLAEHYDLTPADTAELAELSDGFRADGETDEFLLNLPLCAQIIDAAKAAYIASGGSVGELLLDDPPDAPGYADTPKKQHNVEPSIKIERAKHYITPRDKLSQLLFENRITKTPDVLKPIFEVELYKKRKINKPAYIYAILTADNETFPAELSRMHRIYFQAAVSLFQNNKTITPAMIWEFLTDSRPSKAKIAEIEQCIEDMRSMKLSVNLGDYATDHGIATDIEWNDYVMPVSRIRTRVSGILVTGYTAHDISAFPSLRLGRLTGQIDSIPVELITGIPGITRVTNQVIMICDTLLSRIRKKNPNKNDHIIKFSAIYEQLGIDLQDRSQKNAMQRARETAQKILAHWMWKGEIETFALRKGAKNAVDAIVFCKTADEMELFPGLDWARITGTKPPEKK